ncbi:MAG: zonular occludens toxin domain-containing protein [Candidatus Saccharimonas sp.]
MPNFLGYARKSYKFHVSAIRQNRAYVRDRDAFKPHGIQIFYGEQGSGKTITAVDFVQRVHASYPKSILVSNVVLKNMTKLEFDGKKEKLIDLLVRGFDRSKCYIFYSSKLEYELVNVCVRNGKFGVILLTDEYQNYFSNQDSRNVPPWVLEQSAQNRKQARLHVCTSQDFDQVAKPTRRRSDLAFKCRTYAIPFVSHGPIFTVYWAYDAKKLDFDNNGQQNRLKPRRIGFYFHSQALRDSFDTYQVVFTGETSQGVYQYQQPVTNIENSITLLSRNRHK